MTPPPSSPHSTATAGRADCSKCTASGSTEKTETIKKENRDFLYRLKEEQQEACPDGERGNVLEPEGLIFQLFASGYKHHLVPSNVQTTSTSGERVGKETERPSRTTRPSTKQLTSNYVAE